MKPDQLQALLRYRLEQAHETIREAEILLVEDALRGTDSGAISLFDREFVKPGLLPRDLSRSLRLGFNLRQTHDYGEMVEIDRPTAEQSLANAREFVEAVETCLYTEEHLTTN